MKRNSRKCVYIAAAATAAVSLALAITVTAGLLSEAQVNDTLDLTVRFAAAISGAAASVLALRHLSD